MAKALEEKKDKFQEVTLAGGGDFFARNGLLFQSTDEVKTTVAQLIKGEALIHDLATDQSLRGLIAGLEDGLLGIGSGDVKLDDFTHVLDAASDTLENVLAGRPASFSWRVLAQGKPAAPNELRGFIEVRPILDYGALEAGRAASDAIRAGGRRDRSRIPGERCGLPGRSRWRTRNSPRSRRAPSATA